MAKPRTRKMYAVVNKKNPRIDYLDMFRDTDIRIAKGEEIWEVEVKAVRVIKKRILKKK